MRRIYLTIVAVEKHNKYVILSVFVALGIQHPFVTLMGTKETCISDISQLRSPN